MSSLHIEQGVAGVWLCSVSAKFVLSYVILFEVSPAFVSVSGNDSRRKTLEDQMATEENKNWEVQLSEHTYPNKSQTPQETHNTRRSARHAQTLPKCTACTNMISIRGPPRVCGS